MSQIFYCPNCKKTFSSDEPAYICSNCGGSLIATGVPVEAWRSFSDQEKANRKAGWDTIQTAVPMQPGVGSQKSSAVAPIQAQSDSYELKEQTKYLKKLAHDVHFLYGLAVIQVILWVLGILVIFGKLGGF